MNRVKLNQSENGIRDSTFQALFRAVLLKLRCSLSKYNLFFSEQRSKEEEA